MHLRRQRRRGLGWETRAKMPRSIVWASLSHSTLRLAVSMSRTAGVHASGQTLRGRLGLAEEPDQMSVRVGAAEPGGAAYANDPHP
jgi:hypothetical protein